MCSKPSCLGEPWCSEWGCCLSDSDMDDFQPPAKNKQGKETRFAQVQVRFSAPIWRAEWNKAAKEKCPLTLLAFEMDVFYLRPKRAIGPDSPWYDSIPVGKEKLKKYIESMCKEAGICNKKTNLVSATAASISALRTLSSTLVPRLPWVHSLILTSFWMA